MKEIYSFASFGKIRQYTQRISRGYTLIEMIIVVTIISLLIAILMPALSNAREYTRALECATHLRTIGNALVIYSGEHNDTFPVSYIYKGMTLANGVQLPETPMNGIIHWSSVLINSHLLSEKTFQCSSMLSGGLPAANPSAEARETGQANLLPGVVDEQVGRCAYTLNEAICPRNRFVEGFEYAVTPSHFVRFNQINEPARVIMATEWTSSWSAVHVPGTSGICQSYLPVNGFTGIGPMRSDRYDMNGIGNPHPCFGDYRMLTVSDLASGSQTVTNGSCTRLDWIGKNHGVGDTSSNKKTNFVYSDGHVETKPIHKTLTLFQWGEQLYWAFDRTMQ